MRESRILKIISYIAIPILIGCLLLSILYGIDKKDYDNQQIDDLAYFNTDAFLNNYMTSLSRETENLIYRNDKYKHIQDGDYTIYYKNTYGNGDYIYYATEYDDLKDFYYVIIYKQKVFTNIELTTKTNTLDKLKNTVSKKAEKTKLVNIINGNVESDSEIISTKAIQFFDNFKNTYYTKQEIVEPEKNVEDKKKDEVQIENLVTNDVTTENGEKKEKVTSSEPNYVYITTQIQDFQIYSSYKEELIENTSNAKVFYTNMLDSLEKYETRMSFAIPICSVLLIIIVLYLVIAIGHSKGKVGIDLNDFDKVFLEIILVGAVIIFFLIAFGVNFLLMRDIGYSFIWSCLLTGYLVLYIALAATSTTIIKRVKARVLLKYSIIGRIIKWSIRLVKKIFMKISDTFLTLKESWSLSKTVIIYMIIYLVMIVLMVLVFREFGILLDVLITCYVFYKIIERTNSLQKIEIHLQKMYEGIYSDKLESREFTKEFHKWITYINDISKGFEKAIEEGIKSERLKTELITNVSHDIKTPLTSIINYVDLLKKQDIKSEKAKEYIEVLENKSQRLKKLTEDLVEASKASSGNIKLDMQKIRLTELVKQSIGEFEDKFKEKQLKVVTNYPKQDIYIMADNRCLYRVIENLFSNVAKYALENSRVYIDIQKEDKNVIVTIKNISKDSLNISADELMQRFVRGDKSRTTEGSGLGLSISKSLTELQKGKFDLQIDGDLFKIRIEFGVI